MMCGVGEHEADLASIPQERQELSGNNSPKSMDLTRMPGSTSPHSRTKRELCDLYCVVKIDGLDIGIRENDVKTRTEVVVSVA